MQKEIICSKNPNLEIGGIYKGIEGPWKYGTLPAQCIKIIGKSTAEAWIECNVAWGGPRDHFEMLVDINGPWYYYDPHGLILRKRGQSFVVIKKTKTKT